jgi:hypothetical protein
MRLRVTQFRSGALVKFPSAGGRSSPSNGTLDGPELAMPLPQPIEFFGHAG